AGEEAATAAGAGEESPGSFCDAEGFHVTWYLHRFPGVELEAGWLLTLVPPRLAITIAWFVDPLPNAWMVSYLQRQLAQMRARHLDQEVTAASDPVLARALPEAADLQRRIAASEERAFHVALYLTLTSQSLEAQREGVAQVAAAGRAALVEMHPCTFRMADGRLATRPLGVDPLRRRRVLDSSSLVTFFPWLDADVREASGVVLGRSRATGCPVMLDPFDETRRPNANIGVFGHSGAGKTYLLSAIAMGMLDVGAQVFIIDPEREYGALAERLGGTEVDLALGSGRALNVLQRPPGGGSAGLTERWLGPAVADALDLIAVICGDLDEAERASAEAAIRATYGAGIDEPVLADVVPHLPAGRAARILDRWTKGSLGAMFSAPTNVDLDASIVSFSMRELREELVAPVHFLLAAGLWTRVRSRRGKTLLVVDELGLLFDDPTIRRFVVSLARRIRKYDGALVFATQNPGDLLGTDAGAVVASNPAVHFFGAQRPGEAQKLQRAFQLSDEQRSMLETAGRGDFLLLAGRERLAVEVRAPTWQEELMAACRAPAGVRPSRRSV
ncbi:MAG: VirB4 family type IV secretion system protein, partial [Candidatus Dormibacterales bacterium]